MRFCLLLLVLTSLVAFSPAVLKKKKRLTITVEIQWEFGLPVGTMVRLDKHTRLYQPPPLADNFTADDRIKLMWNNRHTNKNYCKVGPSIESARLFYNFWWHQWCKNSTGHDICCKGHKCSCNLLKANCACLTPEGYEYWERKKEIDWQNVKRIWESIKKLNVLYRWYKANKSQGKETEGTRTKASSSRGSSSSRGLLKFIGVSDLLSSVVHG